MLYNARKRIDLWGNDQYLGFVQRTLRKYVHPTHLTVLGDLLGSQWIDDSEFHARADRFWNVVFRGLEKVQMEDIADDDGSGGDRLSMDWSKKLILVAGNHDIGYSGDMQRYRITRFEERFGPVNALIKFYPDNVTRAEGERPSLRIINLNDMTLDGPQLEKSLTEDTLDFVDATVQTRSPSANQATVLLTHVPFYKRESLCVDGPYMTFFPESNGGGVKEQNFLTNTTSERLFEWIFGLPRGRDDPDRLKSKGIILTGHDHHGCNITHYYREAEADGQITGTWEAVHSQHYLNMLRAGVVDYEWIQEITVTSVMGDHGGNAGFLSAWFENSDGQGGEWRFAYNSCMSGGIINWWIVHVADVIAVALGLMLAFGWIATPKKHGVVGRADKEKKMQ